MRVSLYETKSKKNFFCVATKMFNKYFVKIAIVESSIALILIWVLCSNFCIPIYISEDIYGGKNKLRALALDESNRHIGGRELSTQVTQGQNPTIRFKAFTELNDTVKQVVASLPGCLQKIESGSVAEVDVRVSDAMEVADIEWGADKERVRVVTFTVIVNDNGREETARAAMVLDSFGSVRIMGVENPRYQNRQGTTFRDVYVQLDPLSRLKTILEKSYKLACADSSAVKKSPVPHIFLLSWIADDTEAQEIEASAKKDAILSHIFSSGRFPLEKINVRGIFVLVSQEYAAAASYDKGLGAILRAPDISVSALDILAHEMIHALFLEMIQQDQFPDLEDWVSFNHYSFYRNMGSRSVQSPGSYRDTANAELYQEIVVHLFESFLDRTAVAVSGNAHDYLLSEDVELFIGLGMIPGWASPRALGFNKGRIDKSYYDLLEAAAAKRGLSLPPALPKLWKRVDELVAELTKQIPQLAEEIEPFRSIVKPSYQYVPEEPDALAKLVLHSWLWDYVLEKRTAAVFDSRYEAEKYQKVLYMAIRRLEESFGIFRDSSGKNYSYADYLNVGGGSYNVGLSVRNYNLLQAGQRRFLGIVGNSPLFLPHTAHADPQVLDAIIRDVDAEIESCV